MMVGPIAGRLARPGIEGLWSVVHVRGIVFTILSRHTAFAKADDDERRSGGIPYERARAADRGAAERFAAAAAESKNKGHPWQDSNG